MSPIDEAIFKVVRDVLVKHEGHRSKTADELGLSVRTLYSYMERWPELKQAIKDLRFELREDKRVTKAGNAKFRRYPGKELEKW